MIDWGRRGQGTVTLPPSVTDDRRDTRVAGVEPPASATDIRVLHVISGLFYGGGQRVVLDLLKSLPDTGQVDAQLCCLGEHVGSPLAKHCDFTIPYNGRYNSPWVLWSAARQLRRLTTSHPVDIIHTHGVDADLIGALALQGCRERHVCHLHISPPNRRQESWKAAIRRRVFQYLTSRKRTWFIAVSDFVREQMASYYEIPSDRMITVRNGVDLAEFHAVGDPNSGTVRNRVVFGTAARLTPMKGLEYLIQAAHQLHHRGVPIEVRIAGTGSHLKSLEQLAASLDLSDCIHFLGHVDHMPSFYRDLDVFVLPSLSEGLPLVVLEAMATGRPVAATRVAGTPEVVRDGVDGLLVPPADAEALTDALATLAGDPADRREMGTAGRTRVQAEFGLDRVAREIAQVYERVLNDD